MKAEAVTAFHIPGLPMIGLILFTVVFIGIVIWTFHSSNREKFEVASRLPLEDSANERE